MMFTLLLAVSPSAAITRTVCPSGCDYTSMQAAINAGDNGDTISVGSGTYYENVDITKSVQLIGAGADITIVHAANPNDNVFDVKVNNVVISGFQVMDTVPNYFGIYLDNSMYDNITNNIASNNFVGIGVGYSSNNNLTGNTALNNGVGISLYSASNNYLKDNNAASNSDGFSLFSSGNNYLTGNTASNNGEGFYIHGSSYSNILTGNTANFNTYNGISIYSSSNNNITGNTVSNNNNGFYLYTSSNNYLTGNTALNNNYGIGVVGSSSNTIYNNLFNNSNNFDFQGSEIYANKWNITRTPGINIVGGAYLGGNFWKNPTGFTTCTDADMDGFCDLIYTLASENIDYLPLAAPIGYINGTVYFGMESIAGAIVTTNTEVSAVSNASGSYSMAVPGGTYYLTVTKEPEYYQNGPVVAVVESGTTLVKDIGFNTKKPTGTITGTLKS